MAQKKEKSGVQTEDIDVHVGSIYVLTKSLGVFRPETKVTVESISQSGRVVTFSPKVDVLTKRKVRTAWFKQNTYLYALKQ